MKLQLLSECVMIAIMTIGAVFDFDGVVVDSSSAHEESWDLLAVEERLDLPEGHFIAGFGRKNDYIIPNILAWTSDPSEIARLGARKEVLYRKIIAEKGVEVLPGVVELLTEMQAHGIPRVIGSSTDRLNVETCLEVAGLREFFSGIVAAADVSVGKPHPEVFLKAAALIGKAPEQCVVFEDSHAGIEAGVKGGFYTIGVATTHPISTLTQADYRVGRLAELSLERLLELMSARIADAPS